MRTGTDEVGANVGRRRSRDKRRLAIGIAFMAALLGGSLISAFLLGRPAPGGAVAPGVLSLVAGGWVLVLAAAVVFYRTYDGTGGDPGSRSREAAAGREDRNGVPRDGAEGASGEGRGPERRESEHGEPRP